MVNSLVKRILYCFYRIENKILGNKLKEDSPGWKKYKNSSIKIPKIKKDPTILGASAYFHDSSACILKNGKIIAAAEEERFTRVKHDNSFPLNSINYCIKEAKQKEIDLIVFFENPKEKLKRIKESFNKSFSDYESYSKFHDSWKNKKTNKAIIKKFREIGLKSKVIFMDHHLSHAASSYLLSPFNESAILTIDGVGEKITTTLGFGKKNKVSIDETIAFPNSLG
ncbi:MAG: carbamoyltransferase N-terminal domain-containing protein, partial [Nanoarchaeota archaeon]|nr:carbamoyltransferase N-terminal domain-containing protein [Nanoarchaeota archaeon]